MTIEQVLHSANIRSAYKQVVSNRGSAGVDGMTVSELLPHMQAHWDGLRKVVMDNDYVPDAILGVIIPKPNGSKRLLGIPTVTDRMLQQAVAQSPILRTTITLSRLEKRGYQSMASYYNKLSHALWTALYATRMYGGVRGALRSILGGAAYSIMQTTALFRAFFPNIWLFLVLLWNWRGVLLYP